MKTALLFLSGAIFLSSCTHQYYVPNSQNVPLFKKKNEGRLMIGTNLSGVANVLDLQGAMSFTDQIAGSINYAHVTGTGSNGSAVGNCIEGAAGYYKDLGGNIVFESFGGFAYSKQLHTYKGAFYGNSALGSHQFFIQPAIGFSNKHFEFALSAKLSQRTFSSIEFSKDSLPLELQIISDNRKSILLEPAITLRFGGDIAKLQLQYVFLKDLGMLINEEPTVLSISLFINFSDSETKK